MKYRNFSTGSVPSPIPVTKGWVMHRSQMGRAASRRRWETVMVTPPFQKAKAGHPNRMSRPYNHEKTAEKHGEQLHPYVGMIQIR